MNPIRVCLGCGQSDDHPRHIVVVGDTEVPWHMDCHALTGCETCVEQIAGADGAKGDELRLHLTTKDG